MSNVLDENVVILKFDNSNFQKNTQDSISSLDKLKAALDKSGSGEGLKGLGKAAKEFNLDNMSNAVDKVNKRFSLFGIAGMATINRLTNSAITATKNMVTAIPRQILQGGWKRALNIENAKFMIEGLGHSWEDTWDKAGNKVEGVKKSVLAAVNQTRYGLDEAAGIAGQLLASNVKNGEELTSALQSISGLASVTNSQYSDIGRIYAQVAGQGRLMGDQLLQISSRGINAAAAIQEYLNTNSKVKDEALAAAIATGKQTTKMKELAQQATLSEGDVRDMVSAGAISFDVFSKSMAGFWDQAQRANETYEGSLANVNASLSRMGAKFESFKLEALKNIFNTLLPILSRIEVLLDPIAEKFGKVSEAATDFLRESVLNPIGKALGAENLFHGFGKDAEETGDKVSKANDKIQDSIVDTSKKLKVSKKEWQAALDIWNKGSYGNDQNRAEAIRKLGLSYENVQGIINKFYETGFDWKKTESFYDTAEATEKVAEGNKEVGETAAQAEPKLSALGMVVKGIINVVNIAKNIFIGFKNILVVVGKFIKDIFIGPVKTGAEGFFKLSTYVADASKNFADFTSKLAKSSVKDITSKWPKALQVIFKTFKTGLNWITSHIGPAFRTMIDFFKQLSVSEGFVKLKDVFSDLYKSISTLAGGALKTVVDKIKEIANIGSSGGGLQAVVNFFSKLAGSLADFISKVRQGESPFKLLGDAIGNLKSKLSFKGVQGLNVKGGIGAKISDVLNIDSISKLAEKIKSLNIGEKLKNMFTGLVDLVKNADILEKLKSLDFAGFFKTLGDKLGEVDWDRIIELAAKIGGLVAAFVALRDMRKVTDAAVGTMGSVSAFFTSLSDVSDTIKKKIKMESFKAMAIAIAILVGCIVALTLIPTKRLIPAMAGVLGILGAMTAIIAYMNSDKFDSKRLMSVGIAFAGMGASILLLGAGMALIARLKVGDMIKAGVAIVAFAGMLVLVSKLSGDIKGSGGAFIGLAIAVNLLLVAMSAFAALAIGTILKGGLVILGLVTSLALAARIANGSNTKGFNSLATAVHILIPAITIFAMMPLDKILKGGLTVVGLVTALSAAARIANGNSLKGMVGVSITVAVLTGSLMALSMIDADKLVASGSALVGLMLSLSVAAKLAQKSIAGMIAMSLVIAMLSTAIIGLASLDIHASLEICASLSMLALSLAGALALFSVIGGPAGAAIGVAGLAVAIAGVGTILYLVGRLDAVLEKHDIEGFIKRGIPILTAIASGMGQVIGAFASGLLAQLASGGLPVIAKNLSDFMEALQPFFESAKDRKSISAAVGTIKEMASAFSELGKANLMNSLSTFLGGDNVDMEDFGKQIAKFAKGFKKFAEVAGEIDDADLEAAYTVAKIAKAFGDVQDALGTKGGLKGLIMGNEQDLGDFGKSVGRVVESISGVIFSLRNYKFTDDDVALIKPVTKIITAFSELELPEGKSLKSLIAGGELDLATFGTQLGSMVDSMSELIIKLREFKFTDKDAALIGPLISIIKEFASLELPEGMSYKKLILGGPEDIATFADTLITFADKFEEFVAKTAEINPEEFDAAIPKIKPIAQAITAMANAANALPEGGGIKQTFVGGKDLGQFATQLAIFALMLKPFLKNVSEMDLSESVTTKISQLSDIVKAMADVANAIPSDESVFTKLKNLIKLKIDQASIESIVTTVTTINTNAKGLNTSNIKKLTEAVSNIASISDDATKLGRFPRAANLPHLATNVKKFVDTLGEVDTSDLSKKASQVQSAASRLAKAATASVKIDSSTSKKSGSDLGTGLVNGLNGSMSAVKNAAKKLATSARKEIADQKSNFTSAGRACAQGFINGLNNMKSSVGAAGTSLGNYAYHKAKQAIDSKSPSKKFRQLGIWSGEGLVLGMRAMEAKVGTSGYDMAMASVVGANDALLGISDFSNPVITPVIDMSNVAQGAQMIDSMLSSTRAYAVNSTISENASVAYERSKAMDKLIDLLNSNSKTITEPREFNQINNINVDGSENPDNFADRLIRSLNVKGRMM